ncbi:hypothetical protein ACPZ19_19245 [Amycolatopsis lurida]
MPGYQVITSALRAEAPKWDQFEEVAKQAQQFVEGATLETTAFFVASFTAPIEPAPGIHQQTYERFRAFMESVLSGAASDFPQLADALIKAAGKYEEAEAEVELDLNEIYAVGNHKSAKRMPK